MERPSSRQSWSELFLPFQLHLEPSDLLVELLLDAVLNLGVGRRFKRQGCLAQKKREDFEFYEGKRWSQFPGSNRGPTVYKTKTGIWNKMEPNRKIMNSPMFTGVLSSSDRLHSITE
jgi:hypothetical protein